MASWDATRAKSQIRLTAYRLAQVRDRHDQTSSITKRDVATLIGQGDIDSARNKVEKLVRDDRLSALIERLESYCNVLLERFAELGQNTDFESDSRLLEAVCGIMIAAPRTELKDVITLRDMLVQILGPEFTQLAMQNYGNHVPSQIIDTLSKRLPPSAQVDACMASIAQAYQLPWIPPLLPHQKAHALSGILDQAAYPPVVDLDELRRICSRGVPQQPLWLRPRVWKLLLGTVPPQKDSWEIEAHSKRQSYYALAHRLLASIGTLSPPVTPLSPLDSSLLNLAKSLSPLPRDLDEELDASPLCPLDDNAPEGLRIEVADAVDKRLQMIQRYIAGTDNTIRTPEIRLVPADASSLRTPQISVSSPPNSPLDGTAHRKPGAILHSTRSHTTSLLRLLYIHTSLHPSTPTMYLTSLLIPLYVVMVQEIEPAELAHVEADSFWLLTELWGEVSELAEDEGSQEWIVKFGRRLSWADPELWDDLNRKGLNPALPHYSYRWLAPLLTRTLSLPSVLTIWDALFTRTSRTSDHNAKLEFLLDICTGMLMHARVKLFRLGKTLRSPGLWGDVDVTVAPPSPTPVEFEEGFIQGMALLQKYPMSELGGPERVIDIAVGLTSRRELAAAAPGLGGKLRGSVWTGFITRKPPPEHSSREPDTQSDGTPSPEWPDSGAEDGDDTETPAGALLGKFGNTVWRGITNQSSMDVPSPPLMPASPAGKLDELPSPNVATSSAARIGNKLGDSIWRGLTNQSAMEAPPSPTEPSMPSPTPSESDGLLSPISSASIWNYRERLKESDAAAALSKASTNWTAKAVTLWSRNTPTSTASSPEFPSRHSRADSLGISNKSWTEMFPKRGSLPNHYDKEYSPPPRPNFRESRYFEPEQRSLSKSSVGLPSPPNLLIKSKSALASLTGSTPAPALKTAPRPLLLSSSSLITPSNPRRLGRSPTPVPRSPQPQRDSMSSVSSASTSLSSARYSTHSDRDSEPYNTGRFVPLRRGARSSSSRPDVARTTRPEITQRLGPENDSEFTQGASSSSLPRNHQRRTSSEESTKRGRLPDSPSTLPSSPPPKTPITVVNSPDVRVNGGKEPPQGSLMFSESGNTRGAPSVERKVGRKPSWNTSFVPPASPLETASDSSTTHDPGLPVHNKRHGQRPVNLRLKSDSDLRRSTSAAVVEQRSPRDMTALTAENFSEAIVKTPRATDFPSPSSPGRPTRVRRNSRSPRRPLRKTDTPEKGSDGEEGDDEGYDEFLSAYESEDNNTTASGIF